MTATNWHRFKDTDDGDDECTRCGVIVTLEAHMTFTHPCPVPMCTSRANPDDGCLMTPHRDGACRCLYCGRPGDRDHELEEPEVPEEVEEEQVGPTAALLSSLASIASGDVLQLAVLAESA